MCVCGFRELGSSQEIRFNSLFSAGEWNFRDRIHVPLFGAFRRRWDAVDIFMMRVVRLETTDPPVNSLVRGCEDNYRNRNDLLN